jgi:hypothetical protein
MFLWLNVTASKLPNTATIDEAIKANSKIGEMEGTQYVDKKPSIGEQLQVKKLEYRQS